MDTNKENSINPIPPDVQIITLKTGYIRCGAMLTSRNCDTSLRAIRSDVCISEISQSIFADTQFGQLKSKRHSVVMVKAEDDVY